MEAQKLTRLSLFISTGIILFIVESFFPTPLPWIKVGIANIVTLTALYYYGIKEALVVAAFRIVIGALLRGMLFNPLFLISISGGMSAAIGMSLMYKYFKNRFSIIGVSIWGALIFNIMQIIVANLVFVKKMEIYYLLPVGIIFSVVFGFITGLVSYYFLLKSKKFITV